MMGTYHTGYHSREIKENESTYIDSSIDNVSV